MKKIILNLVIILFTVSISYSQTWSPIGMGLNGTVRALTIFNNELLAGFDNKIAKWNGITWEQIGSGFSGGSPSTFVLSFAVFNNELIVGGKFTNANGVSANNIAKWNGSNWSTLGSGLGGSADGVYALSVYNNELIAAGDFWSRIVKWNGTSWVPLGGGTNSPVLSLKVYNNELIAGGSFTNAGGISANHIAKWNGTSWAAFGAGLGSFANNSVNSLAVYNNDLVAGGSFYVYGSDSLKRIAKWNGTSWLSLGTGMDNGSVDGLIVYNNEIIAAGVFYTIGGIVVNNIAKWNGTSWSALGTGLTDPSYAKAFALTLFEGNLVVGGRFTYAGGVSASNIAKWSVGPIVTHTPLPNTENIIGPYLVNCVITPAGSPILTSLTKVHWKRGTGAWDSISMTNTSGNNWIANIPGNGTSATYSYYIRTYDQQGRMGTSGTAQAPHTFTAAPDNVKPVITHTPLGDVSKINFPPNVSANVVDPSDYGGLDSVWVRWYKNNTSNGVIHLKLTSTGGNNFSALLNQPNSYVEYNDSIFYKIFAQDNSSNHNRDSTTLFKFKIVPHVTACIGTGTTSADWPFNTGWQDSRTQMLYTASELTTAGGATGNIFQVGFTIITAASQVMNGFNIRMQNTTATSIPEFVTTGWTTVYTGNYTVPGTGLQYITLQNGFNWNGIDNLLLEICFDNTSYTNATRVQSTSAPGKCWNRNTDFSSGCVLTGGALVNRPNACFKINTIVGVPDIKLELPKQFILYQNYPNPFNPVTTIKYDIPKAQNVKLTVYDLLGREIKALFNEFKQAGKYEINFDASGLSSGTYFYKLVTDDYSDIKKMVIIK